MEHRSFRAQRAFVRYSKTFQFSFIKGLSLGLEYDNHPQLGFVVNCDLGILRVTYFADIELDDEE